MKRVDRFLVVLVAGVVLLMVVAFVLVAFRPQPGYRAGGDPADVAHNYLYALQEEDYERAYSYLSPDIAHYPRNVQAFEGQVERDSYLFNFGDEVSLTVGSADIHGDRATVPVRQHISYGGGGLLGNDGYNNDFHIELERVSSAGPWLLVGADQFWSDCWSTTSFTC